MPEHIGPISRQVKRLVVSTILLYIWLAIFMSAVFLLRSYDIDRLTHRGQVAYDADCAVLNDRLSRIDSARAFLNDPVAVAKLERAGITRAVIQRGIDSDERFVKALSVPDLDCKPSGR